MKRVLLVISNPRQAAYRLRWGTLLPHLAERGITLDVRVRPQWTLGKWLLARKSAAYDAVIIQRKLLDPSEAGFYRRNAPPGRLYFDVDDAVMFRPFVQSAASTRQRTERFMATARVLDLAVVGNEYLKQQFEQQGVRCAILPTTIDATHYVPRQHSAASPLRLVWIGSLPTLPYLQQIVPVLERAHQKPHALELITIADATVTSATLPVRHIPWSEATEAAALAQGDIGIAPTPDDVFARGKCGFKTLQYMASGLPVIASPVGANASIVRQGITGLLPADEQGWIDAIDLLGSDPLLRQRMGEAGRRIVLEEFSLQRAVDFWVELLNR